MKANELRVGNLARVKSNSQEVIIDMISSIGLIGVNMDVMGIGGLKVDDIKPIPLTEEWLKRFGFEKVNKQYHDWEKGDFHLSWQYGQDEIYPTVYPDCKIQYVHQLQNLYFALTGEELKIQE